MMVAGGNLKWSCREMNQKRIEVRVGKKEMGGKPEGEVRVREGDEHIYWENIYIEWT